MKKITLKEAYAILENASAVIVDTGFVTYPSLYELTDSDENEFLFLKWDDEGLEFSVKFEEQSNQEVAISGYSMFLVDSDGDEMQLTILVPLNLE